MLALPQWQQYRFAPQRPKPREDYLLLAMFVVLLAVPLLPGQRVLVRSVALQQEAHRTYAVRHPMRALLQVLLALALVLRALLVLQQVLQVLALARSRVHQLVHHLVRNMRVPPSECV